MDEALTSDTKTYYIRGRIESDWVACDVSSADYECWTTAKAGLLAALSIEEKFSVLLDNYTEFEQELLTLTLNRMVYADFKWTGVQQDIYTVNRRLMNLLSSCRFYTDHIPHTMKAACGTVDADAIKTELSASFDRVFAFRVLDALRNHAQHRGLPIESLSYGGARDERGGHVYAKHTLTAEIDVSALRGDPKLTARMKAELAGCSGKLSITPLVREYIQEFARVHDRVRALIADRADEWERQWNALLDRARSELGANAKGLAVFSQVADAHEREMDIWSDFLERRRFLIQRTMLLPHIASHYVSGAPVTDDE